MKSGHDAAPFPDSMEVQKKALAYAVAEYLDNEVQFANDDMKESLEGV